MFQTCKKPKLIQIALFNNLIYEYRSHLHELKDHNLRKNTFYLIYQQIFLKRHLATKYFLTFNYVCYFHFVQTSYDEADT